MKWWVYLRSVVDISNNTVSSNEIDEQKKWKIFEGCWSELELLLIYLILCKILVHHVCNYGNNREFTMRKKGKKRCLFSIMSFHINTIFNRNIWHDVYFTRIVSNVPLNHIRFYSKKQLFQHAERAKLKFRSTINVVSNWLASLLQMNRKNGKVAKKMETEYSSHFNLFQSWIMMLFGWFDLW